MALLASVIIAGLAGILGKANTSVSQMPQKPTIALVTKAEFRTDTTYSKWSDPSGVLKTHDARRQVMLNNPLSENESDPMQLVGLQGNEVIGTILVIPGRLLVEGQEHRFCWGSNFYVSPAGRASMIALKLVKEFQNLCETVGICGVSQSGYPIYTKFGWTDFQMPRHILLRRSRSVLEQKLGGKTAGRALAPAVDLALLAYNAWVLRSGNDISAQVTETVPDEVAERVACDSDTFLPRSSAVLRWQTSGGIEASPRDRNLFLTVRAKNDVAGYALIKMRFLKVASAHGFKDVLLGSLQDWRVFHPALITYRDVVVSACRELTARGVDAVEVCGSNREEEGYLKAMRLPRIGEVHLMWRAAPGTALDDPRFRDRERWMIRVGDDDAFM